MSLKKGEEQMNKVVWKDNLKEIRKTWPRFLSIFLISLLGVAFYVGIRATSPSMIRTAQNYYTRYALPDGSLQSTLGLNEEDLNLLKAQGLKVEGLKTLEVTLQPQAERIKIYPYQDQAYFYVVEGTLPQGKDEIALDIRYQKDEIKLGEWVTLVEGQKVETSVGEGNQAPYLEQTRFRLVGFVDTSLYYSKISRGVTNVSGFGLLYPSAIGGDLHTEAYYWIQDGGPLLAYSSQYNEKIRQVNQVLEEKLGAQAPKRLEKMKKEGQESLDQAQEKVNQGYREIEEAEIKLSQAKKDLAQGQVEYEAGLGELKENEEKLRQGQILLSQAQAQLDSGWSKLQAETEGLQLKEAEYWNGQAAYQVGQSQLSEKLSQGQVQLDQAWQDLLIGKTQLDQTKSLLEEGQAEINVGQTQLDQAKEGILQQLQEQIPNLDQEVARIVSHAKEQTNPTQDELLIIQAEEENDRISLSLIYLKQEAEKLRTDIQQLETQIVQDTTQFEMLKASLEMLEVQAQNETSQDSPNNLEANSSQGEVAPTGTLQMDIENLKAEILSLENQLAEHHSAKQNAEQALATKEVEISQLEVAQGEIEQEIARLTAAQEQIEMGNLAYDQAVKSYEEGLSQYEEGKSQLESQGQIGQAQLDASLAALNNGRSQLDRGWEAISQGRTELEAGQVKLNQELSALSQGQADLENGRQQMEQALKDLETGKTDYETAVSDFNQGKEEALAELAKSQDEINQGIDALSELKAPQYYVRDRSGFDAYDTLYDNAQQIYEISQIFPLFFFAIALLVTFTTIKRMVSEQRNYLGTMKQMGYPNSVIVSKFVTYSGMAALMGILVGIALGYHIFPAVIMNSYNNIFHFDQIEVVRSWKLNVLVASIMLSCALLPAIWTPFTMLSSQPARLLQPEPPKAGKKILLEALPFIWNKLSFNKKMTIRNLLRYKGRNAMTLVGVAGCTMLIVTGFGISDTISGLVETQFNQLHTYDAIVRFKENTSEEVKNEVSQTAGISSSLPISLATWKTNLDLADQGVSLIVPFENLESYIHLSDRLQEKPLDLSKGAIITERLAEYAKVQVGEVLELEKDGELVQIPIQAITENYIGHYLYLSEEDYVQYFGKAPEINARLLQYGEGADQVEIENNLASQEAVQAVVTLGNVMTSVKKTMESLDLITLVLVVSAGLLAFIVLYNLTNINISERLRELSTIKVLGFYNREVSRYIFDEVFILTGLGSLLGLCLGTILNTYLLKTIQMPNLFFYPQISARSYLISILMTFIFTSLVMVFMHRKISKIDMVEALKAVE